jgi:predicted Zn-dependent peptidase
MSITWEIDTLKNGLRVVTTPVPTAQSVSVSVFVGVGSRAEDRRTNGLSHYLEHMMFKGTERRKNAIEIAAAIEGAGGNTNAGTDRDLTVYYNHMPYDKLPLAMDVLADMLQHSVIDQEEIDRERTVVQEEIRRAFDTPAAWVARLLAQACFGDQPIGWPVAGTVETVQELNRPDFMEHIETWYVPQNMVLSVAGNTTHREVVAIAERLYESLGGGTEPEVKPAGEGIPSENIIVEKRELQQSNLAIGLRSVSRKDPQRFAAMIMNAVLGRGMSSRLFKEVRERRGLAYSISSGLIRYNDTGMLTVSAGVSPEKQNEATKVIREELQKLADEQVEEEELTKARDYTIGSFRLGLESPMALSQRAGEQLLFLDEIEPIEDVVAKFEAVTADDVQAVAGRIFRNDNLCMAVVGPEGDASALRELLVA